MSLSVAYTILDLSMELGCPWTHVSTSAWASRVLGLQVAILNTTVPVHKDAWVIPVNDKPYTAEPNDKSQTWRIAIWGSPYGLCISKQILTAAGAVSDVISQKT